MSIIGDKFLEGIAMLINTSYTQNFIDKVTNCDFLSYKDPIVRYKIQIYDDIGPFEGYSPISVFLYNNASTVTLDSYGKSPLGGPMNIVGDFPNRVSRNSPNIPSLADYYRDGSMITGIFDYVEPIVNYPITYRLTNVTTTGPNEAAVGDTVTVPLTFPEGYGIVNPSSDAYVTCNGILVPSTYSDGQIVFTMPDPS